MDVYVRTPQALCSSSSGVNGTCTKVPLGTVSPTLIVGAMSFVQMQMRKVCIDGRWVEVSCCLSPAPMSAIYTLFADRRHIRWIAGRLNGEAFASATASKLVTCTLSSALASCSCKLPRTLFVPKL